MKRLTQFVKKHVTEPVVDVIRPQAVRFYKDTRPRDANAYHYRYPSPASYNVDPHRFDRALDHRVPYKDSIHDIKYYRHISANEHPVYEYTSNGLTSDMNKQLEC
jgi:hypothetical protein